MESAQLIWSLVLTGGVGVLSFLIKGKYDELNRVGTLLNRTREEIARDTVSRAEYKSDMRELGEKLDQSFHRLEVKIDKLTDRGTK
jgi:hypothetical protein